MNSPQSWKPEMYDAKLGYVSQWGKGVVELLDARPGERILDLGCGTGDLTYQIAQTGAHVTGLDLSVPMIEQARAKYTGIPFLIGNAEQFTLDEPVQAVFSNAALHWAKRAPDVIASVWNALAPGGRFVAEFGGKDNVGSLINALSGILARDYGIDATKRNPWYFPSIGQYSELLERQGFRVTYAVHFDRPTMLEDGEQGLAHWLNGFADAFFSGFDESAKTRLYDQIAAAVRPALFRQGSWFADYKRLRIVAVK
ncbi:methyltransferase domain-containing protein [Paenibacillus sp. y28]|uniref:methyltransferase domain-containing protein n=1 Tax=Paenibacillus sp. y28 TaxID=3129110 RepID=UPI003019B2E4